MAFKLDKSHIFGLPVLLVAVLLHFIVYMAIDGLKTGGLSAIASAVAYIVFAAIGSVLYVWISARKDRFVQYYYVQLTILILSNLLITLFYRYVGRTILFQIG